MTDETISTGTMLYRRRDAVNQDVWQLPLDCAVFDDDAVEAAKAEGWLLAADAMALFDKAGAEKGPFAEILDEKVADIVPLLETLSVDELTQMRAAEEGGKTRAGLLAEIDKAIKAKTEN